MQSWTVRLSNWCRSHPVTFALVVIFVAVWLAELILGGRFVQAGVFNPVLAWSQPWRFATSIFMHDWQSPFHIFFNMFAFVCCSPIFEKMFGVKKYLILIFICGICGNLASVLYYAIVGGLPFSSLGASGIVFGLFGGLIVIHKKLGANANGILMTVGINLLISFYFSGIAWQAHIGGLVAGVVVTLIYTNYFKRRIL